MNESRWPKARRVVLLCGLGLLAWGVVVVVMIQYDDWVAPLSEWSDGLLTGLAAGMFGAAALVTSLLKHCVLPRVELPESRPAIIGRPVPPPLALGSASGNDARLTG